MSERYVTDKIRLRRVKLGLLILGAAMRIHARVWGAMFRD
jgi:hypothetical protein